MLYLLVTVFVLSFGLTGFIRRYAIKKNMIDIPNHRSAHTVAMPRGGGLAFVASFLLAIPWIAYWGWVTISGGIALMTAGAFVALLGFLDDYAYIPTFWRFVGHCLARILALYWLHGMPAITFYTFVLPAGLIANILAFFYLCWLLNLYNFMDGIDGIAGLEAFSVCLGAVLLYWISGEYALMILPLILAVAVMGFLYWNFPPARIFMGDAGSGFLGFVLGVLSIYAAHVKIEFFYSWLILLGVFIVDATITLFRRLFQGQKIYEAHQSHAYQHASRDFSQHLPVTLAVLLINIIWLWPIAILVGTGYFEPITGLSIAYIPLVILAFQFKAGEMSRHVKA